MRLRRGRMAGQPVARQHRPRPARGAILLPGMAWVVFFIGAIAATCALRLHAPVPFVWPLPLLAILYADLSHAERQHEPE